MTCESPFTLPCDQRFLSCMAFSVCEVVRVACQSCSCVFFFFFHTDPTLKAMQRKTEPIPFLLKSTEKEMLVVVGGADL